MKKVFILTQFGNEHPWTQQFIDHVQHLEKYGWYWKIFTPNNLKSKGNVEIIPMGILALNKLIEETTGVNPGNCLQRGVPLKPMSDYYVASGLIFQDWLKDADFWGITNWDVVYGRLDHFFSDELLNACDIFSDDVSAINGVFSLFRNNNYVNHLFEQIPDWQASFMSSEIQGLDEYGMSEIANKVRFMSRTTYPLHSHDRLENHVPSIKLDLKEDGSLWELLADVNPPKWIHARPYIGREIPYFHFQRTKQWPM